MRTFPILFFLIYISLNLHAQTQTIISDGYYGLFLYLENDTVLIDGVIKGGPIDRAGIKAGDKIISINGNKVSGVGLNEGELNSYMVASAGTEMILEILRDGINSLQSYSVILDFTREYSTNCYFDYLVDRTGKLTIEEVASDTTEIRFKSYSEAGLTVYSIHQDSTKEKLDIRPGDKFLSFDKGEDPWAKLWFREFTDSDTIIRIQRDSSEFDLLVDLRKYPGLFINSVLREDLKEESVWLRLILAKELTENKIILLRSELDYDTITLFQRFDNGEFLKKMTGTLIPVENREPFFKGPVFKLNLQKEISDTIYLKLKLPGGWFYPPVFDILSYDYVVRFEQIERMILGAMLGMMLIIALYYLILYIFLYEKSYLVYLFFIISLSFTLFRISGYGDSFLWPGSINFFNDISILFLSIPLSLFLLFGSIYLDIKRTFEKWYKVGRILLIILWIGTILFLIDSFLNKSVMWSGFENNIDFLIGICILSLSALVFYLVILRIRQRFKPATYFLIGCIIILLSVAVQDSSDRLTGFLSNIFNLPVDLTAIMLHASIFIGAILQFLVLSIGLGQKMRNTNMEIKEAQEKLIVQLKENDKLKDKVNRELENKVLERTREIEEQKSELLEQQKEIRDSINYASRIQNAVLPPEEMLKEILPEHFVMFRPRDIVSGDFYWIRQIKNFTIIVAADCTGHGVPGAFMSMLGMSFLNELISKSRFDNAGVILDRLRNRVKETLKQEGKSMEQKDGMDLALAIVDNETLELQFAGAFNPLYIIRHKDRATDADQVQITSIKSGDYTLTELKGDRQPISIYYTEKDFKTHYYKLVPGDTIYIFSDGYQDQMGGPDGKKFMSLKFKKLLMSIQQMSLSDQKIQLEETLDQWKGDSQQIDDILVFGVKW